jgi:integrase
VATVKELANGSHKVTVSCGYSGGRQKRFHAYFHPDPAKTKRQNDKALVEFVVDYERKIKGGKVADGKTTLAEYAAYFLDEYASAREDHYTSSTLAYYRLGFKDVLPQIGHLRLRELLPTHVQQAISAIKKDGRSYYIQRRAFATLQASLNIAIGLKMLDKGSNPCVEEVKPPAPRKKKSLAGVACFNVEQAQAFLAFIEQPFSVTYSCGRKPKDGRPRKVHTRTYTMPFQMRLFFNMALFGGMRCGELIALKWKAVDFDEGLVAIEESTEALRPGGGQRDKDPKTDGSVRDVDMPPVVMEMLKRHKKEQAEYRVSVGQYWQGGNNRYVFTQADGRQMSLTTPTHSFKKAVDRYNSAVQDGKLLADISLHGLRHTSATLAIAANMDIVSVSARLGHTQVSTTTNIYAHALREKDRRIALALQDLLADKHQTNTKQPSSRAGAKRKAP